MNLAGVSGMGVWLLSMCVVSLLAGCQVFVVFHKYVLLLNSFADLLLVLINDFVRIMRAKFDLCVLLFHSG